MSTGCTWGCCAVSQLGRMLSCRGPAVSCPPIFLPRRPSWNLIGMMNNRFGGAGGRAMGWVGVGWAPRVDGQETQWQQDACCAGWQGRCSSRMRVRCAAAPRFAVLVPTPPCSHFVVKIRKEAAEGACCEKGHESTSFACPRSRSAAPHAGVHAARRCHCRNLVCPFVQLPSSGLALLATAGRCKLRFLHPVANGRDPG